MICYGAFDVRHCAHAESRPGSSRPSRSSLDGDSLSKSSQYCSPALSRWRRLHRNLLPSSVATSQFVITTPPIPNIPHEIFPDKRSSSGYLIHGTPATTRKSWWSSSQPHFSVLADRCDFGVRKKILIRDQLFLVGFWDTHLSEALQRDPHLTLAMALAKDRHKKTAWQQQQSIQLEVVNINSLPELQNQVTIVDAVARH
ncbi:hypothetical protein MRX96_035780 [Rhipicephalus microplus]